MLQSNRLFLGSILLGLLALTGILLSGALPFLAYSTVLWIGIGIYTILTGLFMDNVGRVWLSAGATLLEGLFGGMSYSAHFIGFIGGFLVLDFLFKQFVKHHAPIADTGLVAIGTALWLLLSVMAQTLGFWLGFFQRAVSPSFVGRGFLTVAIFLLLVFVSLICVSNYSKYGSLVRL